MDPIQKDESASDRRAILVVGCSPVSNGARILIEEAKVAESEACQPAFDPPENNRSAHIAKRIERKQYRQWEQNLRSKMRGRLK